ncbi:MAG: hypothetical protein ACEQSA_02690 [Weeksellaceae bacterium]
MDKERYQLQQRFAKALAEPANLIDPSSDNQIVLAGLAISVANTSLSESNAGVTKTIRINNARGQTGIEWIENVIDSPNITEDQRRFYIRKILEAHLLDAEGSSTKRYAQLGSLFAVDGQGTPLISISDDYIRTTTNNIQAWINQKIQQGEINAPTMYEPDIADSRAWLIALASAIYPSIIIARSVASTETQHIANSQQTVTEDLPQVLNTNERRILKSPQFKGSSLSKLANYLQPGTPINQAQAIVGGHIRQYKQDILQESPILLQVGPIVEYHAMPSNSSHRYIADIGVDMSIDMLEYTRLRLLMDTHPLLYLGIPQAEISDYISMLYPNEIEERMQWYEQRHTLAEGLAQLATSIHNRETNFYQVVTSNQLYDLMHLVPSIEGLLEYGFMHGFSAEDIDFIYSQINEHLPGTIETQQQQKHEEYLRQHNAFLEQKAKTAAEQLAFARAQRAKKKKR